MDIVTVRTRQLLGARPTRRDDDGQVREVLVREFSKFCAIHVAGELHVGETQGEVGAELFQQEDSGFGTLALQNFHLAFFEQSTKDFTLGSVVLHDRNQRAHRLAHGVPPTLSPLGNARMKYDVPLLGLWWEQIVPSRSVLVLYCCGAWLRF